MADTDKTDTANQKRGMARTLVGTVVSAKADKTAAVVVTRLVKHPRYGKYVRRSTKLQVHDPKSSAQLGDTIEITQCRPISKTKSWRFLKLINRPEAVE